jgi:uncharacterized protein YgbK (DUF1537 family)
VLTSAPSVWPHDVEVLAIDLDVRERSNAAAQVAIETATRRLHMPGTRIFVKIDSTLRGPIRGLVSGALNGSSRSVAIVAPAFPEQGRLLVGGHLFVDGQLGPSLVDVLGSVDSAVATNDLDRLIPSQARYLIVDADSISALRGVAEAAQRHPEWLLVGSAGLARRLAQPSQPPLLELACDGPLLVVAGSPTAVTGEQLRRLKGLRDVVVLGTPPTDERDAGEAAEALADAAIAWAQGHSPRAVILTGGTTARAACHRLDASGLRIRGELEPGIPCGSFHDGLWQGMLVVTKAGGFGTPDTLLDVARALGVSSSSRQRSAISHQPYLSQ